MTQLPLATLSLLLAERGYTISWAVILFSVILALVAALLPAKREDKVPRQRD